MSLTLIATTTVGAGGASSIDFTSIPGTYTDLLVVYSLRSTRAAADSDISIRFNTSSANFTTRELRGNGSSAASYSSSSAFIGYTDGDNATANTFGSGSIYIPNYAGSTNKSFSVENIQENNTTGALQQMFAGLWSQTAALTSVSIVSDIGSFKQYSVASIYGITKGSGGASVSP